MFWFAAKASETCPLAVARFPPLTVTRQVVALPDTAVTSALVPLTTKSASSTSSTALLNTTCQVRLSALVTAVRGVWRLMETTAAASLMKRKTALTAPQLSAASWARTKTRCWPGLQPVVSIKAVASSSVSSKTPSVDVMATAEGFSPHGGTST